MYIGLDDKKDIVYQFQIDISKLENCKIIFAAYKNESYEGSALVLFTAEDGKLYEVNGSHCSCYGLEGQWSPEETSIDALKMRNLEYYGFTKDLEDLFIDLVFEKEVLDD